MVVVLLLAVAKLLAVVQRVKSLVLVALGALVLKAGRTRYYSGCQSFVVLPVTVLRRKMSRQLNYSSLVAM